jgi:hypothetical protein
MGATASDFSSRARSEDRVDVDPRPTSDNARGENRPVPKGVTRETARHIVVRLAHETTMGRRLTPRADLSRA